MSDSPFLRLLRREGKFVDMLTNFTNNSTPENFLKTLFIVSDVHLEDSGSLDKLTSQWIYSEVFSMPGKAGFPYILYTLT